MENFGEITIIINSGWGGGEGGGVEGMASLKRHTLIIEQRVALYGNEDLKDLHSKLSCLVAKEDDK
jgi:hypothetical protein